MMLKTSLRLLLSSSALVLSAQAYAVPVTLGAAADYNGFFLNDVNTSADTEGAMAVGGNATFNNYTLSIKQDKVTSLVVGGDVQFNGGDIHGDVVTGGSYNNTGNYNAYTGTLTENAADVGIDFAQEFSNLSTLSQDLYNAGATGTATYQGNQWWTSTTLIDLNGDGTTDQQIFNLEQTDIENFANLFAVDIEQGTEIIINVAGTNIDLNSGDFQVLGDWSATHGNGGDVLFNFYEAETIDMALSFEGSMLAVNADITANGGQLNGQMIGKSLTGQIQLNQPLYGHNQETVDVPEPSSIFILCAGLAGLIVQRRRMS